MYITYIRFHTYMHTYLHSTNKQTHMVDLEKKVATHSSLLAWEIPRAEEPGGLQSTGPRRVRQDRPAEHVAGRP